MESLTEALDQLGHVVRLSGEAAVKTLDSAITDVLAFRDPACISPMLLALNDEAEFDEGMFSLIHAAESFDDEIYVRVFLRAIPNLQATSPRWASIILMRVLNNQATRDILTRMVRQESTEVKVAIRWLCEKINEKNPTFLTKTLPIFLAAK